MTEKAIPRQGMAFADGGEVTSGSHSPVLDVGIGLGYVPARCEGWGPSSRSTCGGSGARARVVKKPFYTREEKA